MILFLQQLGVWETPATQMYQYLDKQAGFLGRNGGSSPQPTCSGPPGGSQDWTNPVQMVYDAGE